MRLSKVGKVALAAGAVSVYILCPAYRYWVIGSWVGMKIIKDKPRKPIVVRKGSKAYLRFVEGV